MCDQGYDFDEAKAALEEARDELGDDAPSTLYFSPRLDVIVDRRLCMYRWWHQSSTDPVGHWEQENWVRYHE